MPQLPEMPAPPAGEFVRAFERGIAVIRAFAGAPRTLSDVAADTGMSPAAARRYLSTLVHMGYLSQNGAHFYAGVRLVELSAPYFLSQNGMHGARRAVEQLARELGETATITQLDGDHVVNVFAIETPQDLAIQIQPGRRLPAYCTAMGRAALALMPDERVREIIGAGPLETHTPATETDPERVLEAVREARRLGYAYIREEYQPGIQTAAVGLRLPGGAYCAISAPTPSAREDAASYLARAVAPLRAAAERALL